MLYILKLIGDNLPNKWTYPVPLSLTRETFTNRRKPVSYCLGPPALTQYVNSLALPSPVPVAARSKS